MRTHFYPHEHGFHFSNYDVPYSWGAVHGTMLCGGMTLAALDYYYHSVPTPPDTTAPAEDSPLQRYLYQRQMHAHHYALPILLVGRSRWGPNDFATSRGPSLSFGALKAQIDQRRPVPVLLGDRLDPVSTNSHWVLAIDYETNPRTEELQALSLYDNNHPNMTCRVKVRDDAFFRHETTRAEFGFIVPYVDFSVVDPRLPIQGASTPLIVNPFRLPPPAL